MARLSIPNFVRNCFPRHCCSLMEPRESTETPHKLAGVQKDFHDLDSPKQDGTSNEASDPTGLASSTPSLDATGNEDTAPHPIISQPGSRLLTLPAELRTIIYQIALTADRNYIAITPTDHQRPPLLLINRQIRQEAAHLYFSENAFGFPVIDLQPLKPKYGSGHWTVMN
ncbi:hypothetical protein DOTSEDRAFT_54593 [Dothistroma septosporum NZE10]|uniref:F-box domain-containing protein n=1 Tax=Dothistroma septosporum (strain NZE10 / CBS 128990) TaxID=675120 RepID=N1PKS3_DOTSN|nr:hypothetical protein DOTSEDRAFT_54593 [Dothistroma septosporum NZE10]